MATVENRTTSRLENKVAIITGGSGGIGRAAATRFVAEGAKVMLVDLNEKALQGLVNELGSNVASYCVADVSQSSDTERYVQSTVEQFGGVNIYLANAGIEGQVSPIADYDEEMFDRVMGVNVKGVWLGIKHLFPVMQSGGGGSIVITSSTMGMKGAPSLSAYNASKHAVIGLMRSTALEGAPHNIRVNTVNPSPVETRMMRSLEAGMDADNTEAVRESIKASIPLGRYGEPEDIANLMLFLASDESAFLTGSIYMADGGTIA
ncbi:MAG: SDR family oxidoreductase [Pseudomonadales bacterium]|jgi:NAD(P)-dependent dehydrogenase (short-subunit alcohol dehydrogenase family)